MSTRNSVCGEDGEDGCEAKKVSAMSCTEFRKNNEKLGIPNSHEQCGGCDQYLEDYINWSTKKKRKI